MKKILTIIAFLTLLVNQVNAASYSPFTWGIDKTVNPYSFGLNVNGTWRNFGTVSNTGQFTISGLPGLTPSVQGGTVSGLDGGKWFIYNAPAVFDQWPTLRVDRHISSGTGTNGNTYQGIWGYCTTNTFNLGFEWCGLFQAENNGYSSTITQAQNVALNGTMTKKQPTAYAITGASGTGATATLTFAAMTTPFPVGSWIVVYGMTPTGYNGNYVVTASSTTSVSYASTTTGSMTVAGTVRNAVGPSWGGNFVCGEQTNESDPHSGCIAAEMDVHISNANSLATTDANKQRVGVQISLGADIPNTHIGRGLMINADPNTVVDNAIDIINKNTHSTFLVYGTGQTVIASDVGSWGNANFGKQFIIGPENNSVVNPGMAITDANQGNLFGITNNGGVLTISGMPALNDSTTAPVQAIQIDHNTGVVTFPQIVNFGSAYIPKTYTIAGLPACNASNLGGVAIISNGTKYATGGYGTSVGSAGSPGVTRKILCTNDAGATTYAWVYN